LINFSIHSVFFNMSIIQPKAFLKGQHLKAL